MASYKDWIVDHPKKGKIKLGKLSHNELCRFAFDLYVMNQEMNEKLKEFVEIFNGLEKISQEAKKEAETKESDPEC